MMCDKYCKCFLWQQYCRNVVNSHCFIRPLVEKLVNWVTTFLAHCIVPWMIVNNTLKPQIKVQIPSIFDNVWYLFRQMTSLLKSKKTIYNTRTLKISIAFKLISSLLAARYASCWMEIDPQVIKGWTTVMYISILCVCQVYIISISNGLKILKTQRDLIRIRTLQYYVHFLFNYKYG